MSLRKSALTLAHLEANRRSAKKSTRPRTGWCRAQSRMNGLRSGSLSRLDRDRMPALDATPLGAIPKTAPAGLRARRPPVCSTSRHIFASGKRGGPDSWRRLYAATFGLAAGTRRHNRDRDRGIAVALGDRRLLPWQDALLFFYERSH
jgi:hypothetical protein